MQLTDDFRSSVCVTEWPRLNVAKCGSLEETVTRGLPLPWPWTSYRPNCASADYNPGSTGFSLIQFPIHFILPRWLTRIRDWISLCSNETVKLISLSRSLGDEEQIHHHRLMKWELNLKKKKNLNFWKFRENV